jgi:hypothetical protein
MRELNLDAMAIVHDRQKDVRAWRKRTARARMRRANELFRVMAHLFCTAGLLMVFLGACMIDKNNVTAGGVFTMMAGLMELVITAVIYTATEDDHGKGTL